MRGPLRQSPRAAARRERFMPWWLPLAILGATAFALWLLFPKTYIEQTLRAQTRPNAATLAYLQLLVKANPDNLSTRLMLIEKALLVQNLPLARQALAHWRNRPLETLPLDIARARLHLLRLELLAGPPQAPERQQRVARYTRDLLQLAPRLTTEQALQETRFTLQLGAYATVAAVDRTLLRRTAQPALREQVYTQGITALLAGGQPRAALAFARTEMGHVPHNDALWRRLIRLALAAGQPELAARCARRLVGLPEPAG
ncbi:hypothetical protein [Acidihalobacter ferrooxydans]|uniref:Uncharacterized protein n=1 Tax=Acidihalobacter ferrooxydans TaxID=1765967 RepID=A0A1P8UHU7_9GAMM|nr:hypothetical protein [Acidihalobacter ferrooxydans]APZ43392.1 hypothetical protein BW247_10065 [Acidihalobacter ferrooxydans]